MLNYQNQTGIYVAQAEFGDKAFDAKMEFDTRNGLKKIGMILPLCVPLLVSSVRKTDAAAAAAEARGFELRTRASGYKKYTFTAFDIPAAVVCCALIVFAIVL